MTITPDLLRFTGETGVACFLKFNRETGWLEYISDCYDEDSVPDDNDSFNSEDSF